MSLHYFVADLVGLGAAVGVAVAVAMASALGVAVRMFETRPGPSAAHPVDVSTW